MRRTEVEKALQWQDLVPPAAFRGWGFGIAELALSLASAGGRGGHQPYRGVPGGGVRRVVESTPGSAEHG